MNKQIKHLTRDAEDHEYQAKLAPNRTLKASYLRMARKKRRKILALEYQADYLERCQAQLEFVG